MRNCTTAARKMAEETETQISTAQVEKAVGAIQYLSSLNLAPTSQEESSGSGLGSRKSGTGFVHGYRSVIGYKLNLNHDNYRLGIRFYD